MKFKQILIKEILFYWIVSSILILIYSYLINNLLYKILSLINILLSKILFDNYIKKIYTTNNKLIMNKNKVIEYDNT